LIFPFFSFDKNFTYIQNMIKVQCPLCKGMYRAQLEWVGKQAKCPHCHQKITIQTPESETTPLVEPGIPATKDDISPAPLSVPVLHDEAVPAQPAPLSVPVLSDNTAESQPASLTAMAVPVAEPSSSVDNSSIQDQNVTFSPQQPIISNGLKIAKIETRISAFLVDGLFLSLIGVVVNLLLKMMPQLLHMKTLIFNLIIIFYEAYFLSQEGATPGQRIFHLMVLQNGDFLSFWKALVRIFIRWFGFCFLGIGLIIAFFNKEHQTLQDIVCDTVVVEQ